MTLAERLFNELLPSMGQFAEYGRPSDRTDALAILSAALSQPDAAAMREVVLEEAARVAENARSYDDMLQRSAGCLTSGQRIAQAIRALG